MRLRIIQYGEFAGRFQLNGNLLIGDPVAYVCAYAYTHEGYVSFSEPYPLSTLGLITFLLWLPDEQVYARYTDPNVFFSRFLHKSLILSTQSRTSKFTGEVRYELDYDFIPEIPVNGQMMEQIGNFVSSIIKSRTQNENAE